MSGDRDVGYGKPPEHTRFALGKSGNPRGRPRKRERYLLPRQLRADILQLLEQKTRVQNPDGTYRESSWMELLVLRLFQRSAMGNPTAMKMSFELIVAALSDRLNAHGPVRLLEAMLDNEDRAAVGLHEIGDPKFDLKRRTRKLY